MDLSDLRAANIKRQIEWEGDEKTDLAFRALEVAGEAGELCEAVKKYLRAALGVAGTTATKEDIAREMGDVLISLDLLAIHLGIDLEAATAMKFNATSEKYGLHTRITPKADK